MSLISKQERFGSQPTSRVGPGSYFRSKQQRSTTNPYPFNSSVVKSKSQFVERQTPKQTKKAITKSAKQAKGKRFGINILKAQNFKAKEQKLDNLQVKPSFSLQMEEKKADGQQNQTLNQGGRFSLLIEQPIQEFPQLIIKNSKYLQPSRKRLPLKKPQKQINLSKSIQLFKELFKEVRQQLVVQQQIIRKTKVAHLSSRLRRGKLGKNRESENSSKDQQVGPGSYNVQNYKSILTKPKNPKHQCFGSFRQRFKSLDSELSRSTYYDYYNYNNYSLLHPTQEQRQPVLPRKAKPWGRSYSNSGSLVQSQFSELIRLNSKSIQQGKTRQIYQSLKNRIIKQSQPFTIPQQMKASEMESLGPGYYDIKPIGPAAKGISCVFKSRVQRDDYIKSDDNPAPGSYDLVQNQQAKNSVPFGSKSPRFLPIKLPPLKPDNTQSETEKQQQKAQTRQVNFIFHEPRFSQPKPSKLGPGKYKLLSQFQNLHTHNKYLQPKK